MRPILRRTLPLISLAALALLVGCTPRYTGPWDMAELKKPPSDVQWGPARLLPGKIIQEVYYTNESYEGRATRVFAYYARPNPVSGRLPAMVLCHGGGGKAFREWAEMWADRGYAAIAMDTAGYGPDGQRLSDGGPNQDLPSKFNDIGKGVREAWSYHAVAAVIRAHSLICSLPEVDAHRTGITGISWGGYLTCVAAGLDERFKVAVPVYGCGFLYENSIWLDRLNAMPPEDRQAWIDNYDPSKYLPGLRQPVLFVAGTNDNSYPLDSYQRSYQAVAGPRTLCITVGMKHSHPAGWAPQEIGLFVDSVLRGGQPLAQFGAVTCDSAWGTKLTASIRSAVPIQSAALHYTTDFKPWRDREWHSVPAHLDATGRIIVAELPVSHGITWFLTATDERGATVSTEHRIRARRSIPAMP